MASRASSRWFGPLLLVPALALAGCSAGVKEVPASEVEEQAAEKLAAQVNQPKPSVDCPGPLKAEVGATLDCVLTAQGETQRYPVKVSVTSIEDDTVAFDIQVGDAPLP